MVANDWLTDERRLGPGPQYQQLSDEELTELARKIHEAQRYYDPSLKPTNPKDAIGSDKMPLHLWPETATIMGCLGCLDGMLKYGRANWRDAGIKASIYVDALKRHVDRWFEGEDIDEDSGLPHECHMLACIAIIVDAKAAGRFIDDRQYPGGFVALLKEMTPHVKRLKEKHANKDPHHFTIQDVANGND